MQQHLSKRDNICFMTPWLPYEIILGKVLPITWLITEYYRPKPQTMEVRCRTISAHSGCDAILQPWCDMVSSVKL